MTQYQYSSDDTLDFEKELARYEKSLSRQERRKKAKPRKTDKNIWTWLRKRTSAIDFGRMILDAKGWHPIHCNANSAILEYHRCLQNETKGKLEWLRVKDYQDHLANRCTLYFTGAQEVSKRITLGLVDIDCHDFGSPEGARAFAEFLVQELFPNAYYEVSTNGNGVHLYFLVQKSGERPEVINELLKRLDAYLKHLLKEGNFDVQNVEIKGTLPERTWGSRKYEMKAFKAGMPAKLPRLGTPEKETALKNTTVLKIWQLEDLPTKEELDLEKSAQPPTKFSKPFGSSSGVPFSQGEMDQFPEYLALANRWLKGKTLATSGRAVATVEDVAVFLICGKAFTSKMNRDGTMPTNRFRKVHRILKEMGVVNRSYDGKRLAAVRNFFSALGLLDWEDERYFPSTVFDEKGKGTNGVAAKWQFSARLMAMLDFENGNREEEDILRGTHSSTISDFSLLLTECDTSELMKRPFVRPICVFRHPDLLIDDEENKKLVGYFEIAEKCAA